MDGKSALIIAPRLPEYDRESGSKRIYDHLQVLLSDNWSVCFAAENTGQEAVYKRLLEQQGVRVHSVAGRTIEQILGRDKFDLAILAFWRVAEKYLPSIRKYSPDTKIIIDSIDLHFLRKSRQIFSGSCPDGISKIGAEFADEIAREINVYAAADAVFTVSQKEAEWLKDLTAGRLAVFSVPDGESLEASDTPFDKRHGILFVGNFWHKPNIHAVNYLCREILPCLNKDLVNDHPVYIVGHALNEVMSEFTDVPPSVNFVGWVPSLIPYFNKVRITVAPLLYGAGTKRKIIQSILAGTPAVTTTIGSEGLNLRSGKHALVADDPHKFAQDVERLLVKENLWNKIALEGRNHLLKRHSQEAAQKIFKRSVSSILSRRNRLGKKQKGQPLNLHNHFLPGSSKESVDLTKGTKLVKKKLKVLVLGIYLADKPNNIERVVETLAKTKGLKIQQKWVAIGKSRYSPNVEQVTVKRIVRAKPKFELINDLLLEESLGQFDYVTLFDDDIGLPNHFLEKFILLQENLDFVIAQPARTGDSYIDLPIVRQQEGILARETLFVEVGPVVSFNRKIYDLVFPFDMTSPMGWGYSNIWGYGVKKRGLKMGIIDSLPVSHKMRKPISFYNWEKANAQRSELLKSNIHLPYDECFSLIDVFGMPDKQIRSCCHSSVETSPLISIIINSRDNASQLRQCLQNLVKQKLPKACFEIVVIDNGSTDGAEIFHEFSKKSQIRYLYQHFSDTRTAISLGIWISQAPLVMFWDAKHDVMKNDLLVRHIRAHDNHFHSNLAVKFKKEDVSNKNLNSSADKTSLSTDSLTGLSCKREFLVWNSIFENSNIDTQSAVRGIEGTLIKKGLRVIYDDDI